MPAYATPPAPKLKVDFQGSGGARVHIGAVAKLDTERKSRASAATVIAVARKRAKLTGTSDPSGSGTSTALEGFSRSGRHERGRGQVPALDLDAISEIAAKCAPLDRAIVLVMFQACLRRSETSAPEWRDIEPAACRRPFTVMRCR